MVSIRKCLFSEIAENRNFPVLAHEYAEESSLAGLPDPDEKAASYRLLQYSPIFNAFGAFDEDLLIGFAFVLTPIIPHYGVAIAVTESLFVGKEYRRSGAGLKLIRAAEGLAKDLQTPGILFSAPSKGQLAEVLPRMGYRETNRVFLKGFPNG